MQNLITLLKKACKHDVKSILIRFKAKKFLSSEKILRMKKIFT